MRIVTCYHQPLQLLELVSFKAVQPREGQFRVGNMHFELTSQQPPLSSVVRVLQTNYRLRGPSKSYASVVAANVPGRHSKHCRVTNEW